MNSRMKWLATAALSVATGACVLLYGPLGATAEQTPNQKRSPQWVEGVQDVQPGEEAKPKKNLKSQVDTDKFHADKDKNRLEKSAKDIREHKMKPNKSDTIPNRGE